MHVGGLTAERRQQGHYPKVHEGQDGVAVLDAPVVRFEKRRGTEAKVEEEIDGSNKLTDDQLQQFGVDYVNQAITNDAGARSTFFLWTL